MNYGPCFLKGGSCRSVEGPVACIAVVLDGRFLLQGHTYSPVWGWVRLV